MSFSAKAKGELSRIVADNKCCQISELAALLRMNGTIQMSGNKKVNLKISTENPALARRIFTLLKKTFDIHTEVMVRRNSYLKKNNNYIMIVTHQMGSIDLLAKVAIMSEDSGQALILNYAVPWNIINKSCCKRSYLRGAFLGGGSVSDPEKTYHLEIVTQNQDHCEEICKLINSFGLNSKTIQRKNSYVIYLKEGEQIVDFLNIIGAHSALLNLENVRIYKEMRNNVNRIVNCETANLSKTVNAAYRQISNIEYIKNKIGFHKLPVNLREIAELRINYQEASLKELGEMLDPPIGKSGVNHRLRKLDQIAEKLKDNKGEI